MRSGVRVPVEEGAQAPIWGPEVAILRSKRIESWGLKPNRDA
jgi:hypothetical protein